MTITSVSQRQSLSDASWRRLLNQIHEGMVVPVLGSHLLDGEVAGEGLQARVARRVLEAYGAEAVALEPGRELNDAVTRVRGRTRLQELYETVHEAIVALTPANTAIPPAIAQLAEIRDFSLIVTGTPDDLLARCLRRRCNVNEIIHSPNLSTVARVPDLPPNWEPRRDQVDLLYLFGKAQRTPVFAIHEEDVLEYAHNMISGGSNVPKGFLAELQARNLLFIGCRFPDWLSRFLLRATNKDRLSLERSKREWLVERQPEEGLTLFVRSYSKDTEILAHQPPDEFVAELHRRWSAAYASEPETSGVHARPRSRATFFISYSRQTDSQQARALAQCLLELGLSAEELWFDGSEIEPGDDFIREIMQGIDNCRYFLPLLSRSADQREEAFVFREWVRANERDPSLNREFIIPLVIDSEYKPRSYTARPASAWSSIDFGHAPEGIPDARTLIKLKELVRRMRREGAAA